MYSTIGFKLNKNKISKSKDIIGAGVPEVVHIPLNRHKGLPAQPQVKNGASVCIGTLIGSAKENFSANVYSSVAGTVIEVSNSYISIKTSEDVYDKSIDTSSDIITEIPENRVLILEKIRKAGIVGMGGAGFPTALKLEGAESKKIECLIINGMEGEPYFTGDNRLMIEKAEEIIIGARIINKLLGIQKAIIAIDEEYVEAASVLTKLTKSYVGVNVKIVKNKYPSAAEKQLIKALFGVEISASELTSEYGYVVQNISTVNAVYNAVMKNKPLYERVVTVSGDAVADPQNFLVRAGTPVSYLIDKAADKNNIGTVILDGLMMGSEIEDLDTPVSLLDGAVLLLKNKQSDEEATPCIKCNRCAESCPVRLQPYEIADRLKIKDYPKLYKLRVSDCINCGLCSYVCPAKIPLLDLIKIAKEQVR